MTKHKRLISVTHSKQLVPLLLVALGFAAQAQERDSEFVRVPVTERVSQLWRSADLVAVGKFGSPVELGDDPISLLTSRELDMDFAVETVYKGLVRPGDKVQVRLLSDMLVFPGGSMSRYDKRHQLFEERAEALQVVAEGEAQLLSSVQGSARRDLARELDRRNSRLVQESMEMTRIQRIVVSSHASTLYKRGGAIEPGESYLIAVNMVDGNAYFYELEEFGFGILWGDLADDVSGEIERQRAAGEGVFR